MKTFRMEIGDNPEGETIPPDMRTATDEERMIFGINNPDIRLYLSSVEESLEHLKNWAIENLKGEECVQAIAHFDELKKRVLAQKVKAAKLPAHVTRPGIGPKGIEA